MSKPFGIIYKVTNIKNYKCYVGQTTSTLRNRRSKHISDALSDRTKMYFHKSIKKHGKEAFIWEILCLCYSKREMNEKEKFFIKELNSYTPYGYNLTFGGEGTSGYKCSDERKKILHDIMTSDTVREKISISKKGVKRTDEDRKKISDAKIGVKRSEETKRKIRETKERKKAQKKPQ